MVETCRVELLLLRDCVWTDILLKLANGRSLHIFDVAQGVALE